MKRKASQSKERNTEKLVANLVWDYCEKMRRREPVVFEEYQAKCPGKAAKKKFEIAVAMSGFIDLATDHEIRMIEEIEPVPLKAIRADAAAAPKAHRKP